MTAPAAVRDGAVEQFRTLVQREVYHSGWTQAEIAHELGVSQKHLSQVLTGKARLSVEFAAAVLFVCGRELRFGTGPYPSLWDGGVA